MQQEECRGWGAVRGNAANCQQFRIIAQLRVDGPCVSRWLLSDATGEKVLDSRREIMIAGIEYHVRLMYTRTAGMRNCMLVVL